MNVLFIDLLTALLNEYLNLCVLLTLGEEHRLRMFLLFFITNTSYSSFFFLLYF